MKHGSSAELKALVAAQAHVWDSRAEAFCDEACLQRYLRARQGDVKKAAAMLTHTLEWRKEHKVDEMTAAEFADMPYNKNGWVYVDGNDAAGRTIVMFRKRRDKLGPAEHEPYLRYMTFVLETAVKNMKGGQETWIWLLDLAAYSPSNAPALSVTLSVLQMLANHYPERLHKAYVVNAPSVFQLAWKVLQPFLDPVTRSKAEFVDTRSLPAAGGAAKPPAAASSGSWSSWFRSSGSSSGKAAGGGSSSSGKSAVSVTASSTAAAAGQDHDLAVLVEEPPPGTARDFGPFVWMYNRQYSYERHQQLLAACGW